MQRKYIQKLIDLRGRANLSRNSLFNHLFVVLEPFENFAAVLRGSWQRSHYSWIMRPQCCLVKADGQGGLIPFRRPSSPLRAWETWRRHWSSQACLALPLPNWDKIDFWKIMAFTGAKKRSIYEIQINQCTFFWRCNSGNVDFFHCDGGDGTLVVWGVICLIGLLSRPLSLGGGFGALIVMHWTAWNVFLSLKISTFFCKKKYFFLAKKSTSRHVLCVCVCLWRGVVEGLPKDHTF